MKNAIVLVEFAVFLVVVILVSNRIITINVQEMERVGQSSFPVTVQERLIDGPPYNLPAFSKGVSDGSSSGLSIKVDSFSFLTTQEMEELCNGEWELETLSLNYANSSFALVELTVSNNTDQDLLFPVIPLQLTSELWTSAIRLGPLLSLNPNMDTKFTVSAQSTVSIAMPYMFLKDEFPVRWGHLKEQEYSLTLFDYPIVYIIPVEEGVHDEASSN